jgi:hypothetical protein
MKRKGRQSVQKCTCPKMTHITSGDEVQSLVPIIREAFSHQIGSHLPINASALSDARFPEERRTSRELGARSIKPLEGSRPWLRRTRALWRLNVGRLRCGGSPRRCDEVRQTAAGAVYRERVSQRQRGESWKKRFTLRQGTEGDSARKRVKGSSWRESSHAAAVSRGGERSWISAAVNLWTTTIGPPHLGQRQRSFDSEAF